MRARTKKHHTKNVTTILESDTVSVSIGKLLQKEFPERTPAGVYLEGIRHRENLTQSKLAEKLGTNQANISNMERGKRPIGKKMAKRIGELFNIDYRHFL